MDDVLLTEVAVRKHEIYHAFKGLGGYFKAATLPYNTKVLGRLGEGAQAAQDIITGIAANPSLAGYRCGVFKKPSGQTHFDVVWLHGPPNLNELVRSSGGWSHRDDEYKAHRLPKEFVTGHYTIQARGMPCPPWRWGALRPEVTSLLEYRQRVQEQVRSLERRVDEKDREKSVARRSAKKRKIVDGIGLPAHWRTDAANICGVVENLHAQAQAMGGSIVYVPPGKRNGVNDDLLQVHLPEDDYFVPSRMMTPQEVRGQRWLVFDTESPFFEDGDQTVTWIAYAELAGDKIVDRGVFTSHDVGLPTVEGYTIREFLDGKLRERSERMVASFADFARQFTVISAYNAAYDLPTCRAMGDFPAGERDSNPKKEVTTKFFERIGLAGRLVIDPMRVAKMSLGEVLVNAKADLVLPYLMGTKPFKTLAHADLGQLAHAGVEHALEGVRPNVAERLEEERRRGEAPLHRIANRVSCRYVCQDTENTARALLLPFVDNALKIAFYDSDKFGTDYNRALHLPSAVNEGQQRCYRANTGLWREQLFPPTKKAKQRETIARDRVPEEALSRIPVTVRDGLHDDVWLVRLPLAEWMGKYVGINYPTAKPRVRGLEAAVARGCDPLYRRQIHAGADALGSLLQADIGKLVQADGRFEGMLDGHDRYRVMRGLHAFIGNLDKGQRYDVRKRKLSYRRFKEMVDGLPQARRQRVQECMDREFGGKRNPSLEFYRYLLFYSRLQDTEARVFGNYGVDGREVLATLRVKSDCVWDYVRDAGIGVLHKNGLCLYVTGPKGAIVDKGAPWMALVNLPRVYVSRKFSDNGAGIYYAQEYFYKGLKVQDKALWNANPFEMALFGRVLDDILAKDDAAARQHAREGVEGLVRGIVDGSLRNELLFGSKASGKSWYFGTIDGVESPSGRVTCSFKEPESLGFVDENGTLALMKKIGGKEHRLEVKTDASGLRYVETPCLKTTLDPAWGTRSFWMQSSRFWFLQDTHVKVDATLYAKRTQQRLVSLLNPVTCGKAGVLLGLRFKGNGNIDEKSPLVPLSAYEWAAVKQASLF